VRDERLWTPGGTMTILVGHFGGSIVASLKRCMEVAGLQVMNAGDALETHGTADTGAPKLVLLRLGPACCEVCRDDNAVKTVPEVRTMTPGRGSDEMSAHQGIGTSRPEQNDAELSLQSRRGKGDTVDQATIRRAIGQSVVQGRLSHEQGTWLLAALKLDSGPAGPWL
jgi:hypothetical protein